ncbi:MAG: hypothetical protein CL908_08890 [Deltaproteobacteria bacterium]|jgi:hypothetical protein|nr:hypothetical protein [Deltaproteobacteria bacterium]
MGRAAWTIRSEWDGTPAPAKEQVRLTLAWDDAAAELRVEAPFHDDPAPPGAAGPHPGLWEFEVVELFLLGEEQRYLEIEIGPHGHHWVLELHGARRVVREGLPLRLEVERQGEAWRARADFPATWLPPGLFAANAYAIHGHGSRRRYLAASPVPGTRPDFHQLEHFPRIAS